MIKNQVCVFLCAKSSVIGDKIDIKLHYIELLLFLSMWTGGGCRMSTLVHSRGGRGSKLGHNWSTQLLNDPLVGTKLILVHKWQFLNEVNRIPITCPFNILSSKFNNFFQNSNSKIHMYVCYLLKLASTKYRRAPSDLQLPLQQWGAGNVYLLVSSKAKL